MPIDRGIAGRVVATGTSLRVDDACASPFFNPEIDRVTGFRTRSVLCVPITDRRGRVFAVAQLLNKRSGAAFDEADERRYADFAASLGVLLESVVEMTGPLGGRAG